MKHVLLTGAKGFIGRNLKQQLQNDAYLYCPSSNELNLLDQELVRNYLQKNGIQIVVHCATVGGSRKTNYDQAKINVLDKNIRMFMNLFENIDKLDKLMTLGSGASYCREKYIPHMEEAYLGKHIPPDAYGFSKYLISKLSESYSKVVDLRLFGIYGKYEDYTFRFISNSILKNLFELPITINQNVKFSYLFVEDLVQVIRHFLSPMTGYGGYNVVPDQVVDLLTIARSINKISGKSSEIHVLHEGLNLEYSGENSKLRREITNLQFTPIEKGIEALFSWYKANLDKIDKREILEDKYLKFCHVTRDLFSSESL